MDREFIIFASQVVLSKFIDKAITYFWIDTGDNSDVLIIRYLPLPSYNPADLLLMKKQIALIMNTAEDNEVFESCRLSNIHGIWAEAATAIF